MHEIDTVWGGLTALLAMAALTLGCGDSGSEGSLRCGEGTEAQGGRIASSYARGDVGGAGFVGGLVGELSGGTVTMSYATGDVEADHGAGGLFGRFGGMVSQSYATGTITGGAGGLVGSRAGGTVEDSYFLDDGSDPSGAYGTPLTRAEFGEVESFVDWDFDEAWAMQPFEAPDFARPTLRVNPEPN